MNLSQYRLDEKLLTIFEHLTDEQKIEKAIQKYPVKDVLRIFTYYELEQHTYAKKLLLKKYRNSPQDLYCYAREVICGRWSEAEPIIMASPKYAYYYTFHVIKGRWPEAEPTIMTNAEYIYYYSLNIIKGRWPEAELIIISSSKYAYLYTLDIIKGRWPEAEPTMKHTNYWHFYEDLFKL